jgi:hypothetical protein
MVAEKIRSIENSSEACLLALGYSEPWQQLQAWENQALKRQ